MTNNYQNTVSNYQTLTQERLIGMMLVIAFLSLLLGAVGGFLIGGYVARQNSDVQQYATLMYNTCKASEQVLNGYNSQRSRRDCTYLLDAAKHGN